MWRVKAGMGLVLGALVFLAGCGGEGGATRQAQSTQASNDPPPDLPGQIDSSSGPVEEMTGIWESGFEVSAFAICADLACTQVAPPAESCWLNGDKHFFDQLRATGNVQIAQRGNPHWRLRLKGSKARGGLYGHMGGHRCQVDARELISIEEWKAAG